MKSKILLGINIISLIFAVYFLFLYMEDRRYVRDYVKYLKDNNIINGQMGTHEKSIRIRDFISKSINTNLKICQFFDYSRRPLWGYRVSEILKSKEGQCGEGTRLLINIYSTLSVPSRRVYLFNFKMNHALMEIFDENNWILVDSINSPPDFKEYIELQRKGAKDFFIVNNRNWVFPDPKISSFGFYNFSYFNWNRLFSGELFKTEIYMHKPLFDNIQLFLENPPLIFSTLILIILLTIDLTYLLFKSRRKIL